MKAILNKIASFVFALALLVTALGTSATPARADGPTLNVTDIHAENPGFQNGWGYHGEQDWSCDPWQSGFKCHWRVVSEGDQFQTSIVREVDFEDSRGTGSQTYYYFIEGTAEGYGFAYSSPGITIDAVQGMGTVSYGWSDFGGDRLGQGYKMITGSLTTTARTSSMAVSELCGWGGSRFALQIRWLQT